MRKSPRDRRLAADYQSLQQLSADSSIFSFSASGEPPQSYRLRFAGYGVKLNQQGQVEPTMYHEVVVELGAAYPRLVPNLAWQTPIFHPNISHNGVVCLGGYGTHWVPSLTLSEMCVMLWDMIRYKNFDTESPYNREAAMWAKHQTDFALPLDPRPLRDHIAKDILQPNKQFLTPKMVDISVAPSGPDVEIIEDGIEILEIRAQPPRADQDILFIE